MYIYIYRMSRMYSMGNIFNIKLLEWRFTNLGIENQYGMYLCIYSTIHITLDCANKSIQQHIYILNVKAHWCDLKRI